MNRKELIAQIREKQSFLCVGLDTDINKIPQCIIDEAKAKDGDDYIFRALCEFNALIIDALRNLIDVCIQTYAEKRLLLADLCY